MQESSAAAALPAPGTLVWIRQRRWRVERARRVRHTVWLDVSGRSGRLTFLAPFDRPAFAARTPRPARARPAHAKAILADMVARSWSVRTLASAVDARMTLLPHQLEAALAVLAGTRRVLIADEVGLGKTIQAGLVVAELRRRLPVARILIIVPSALRDQWVEELASRFGIPCTTADRAHLETLTRVGARGDNPWRRAGVWVASLDYLKQPHVLDALPADPWDAVILDEAHGACGDSERHAAADEIARRAHHVLLLTATPHSGDEVRFSRLLEIGAVSHSADRMMVFRRTRDALGIERPRRIRWHHIRLGGAETRLLDALRDFESTILARAGARRQDAALLMLSVFRKRALSTAAAVAASLTRRLSWIDESRIGEDDLGWIQPALDFDPSDELSEDERQGLLADIGLPVRHERTWLKRLIALAAAAERSESKLTRLVSLVRRTREPAIVFTEFRKSLEIVSRRLASIREVAVLHGGQSAAERRVALTRFRAGEAGVLVATDVAGQGLNLQDAARWVVSLELPWNPARLEQRFGRVDRIGQSWPVHFTLLVARHEAESDLLCRLARRTLAARQALGSDVLRSAVPSEGQLRASLLAGAALVEPIRPATPVRPCRRWERPALAFTRSLARRRRLSACWRRSRRAAGCIWTVARRRRWLGLDLSAGGVLVFDVPILDGTGATIELSPVAVQLDGLLEPSALGRGATVAAARAAAARLTSRVARLSRLLRASRDSRAPVSRAIADAIADAGGPLELQPGLFDKREVRAFDAARRARDDARRRIVSGSAVGTPQVHVGQPLLRVAIFGPPRSAST